MAPSYTVTDDSSYVPPYSGEIHLKQEEKYSFVTSDNQIIINELLFSKIGRVSLVSNSLLER